MMMGLYDLPKEVIIEKIIPNVIEAKAQENNALGALLKLALHKPHIFSCSYCSECKTVITVSMDNKDIDKYTDVMYILVKDYIIPNHNCEADGCNCNNDYYCKDGDIVQYCKDCIPDLIKSGKLKHIEGLYYASDNYSKDSNKIE